MGRKIGAWSAGSIAAAKRSASRTPPSPANCSGGTAAAIAESTSQSSASRAPLGAVQIRWIARLKGACALDIMADLVLPSGPAIISLKVKHSFVYVTKAKLLEMETQEPCSGLSSCLIISTNQP